MTGVAIAELAETALHEATDSLEYRYLSLPFEKRYELISQAFPGWLLSEPVEFPGDHSTFGWECRVPDCSAALPATGTSGLCPGHVRDYKALTVPMEVDEFANQASVRSARSDWALKRNDDCRVCGPAREAAGWGLCQSHMNCCRRAMDDGQSEEDWLKTAVPRPAYPACSIPRCVHDGVLTSYPGGGGPRICASHYMAWTSFARASKIKRDSRTWNEWLSTTRFSGFEPAGNRGLLRLAHLPESVQCEVRYALHRYGSSPRRARWRPGHIQLAVDWVAAAGVNSLSDPMTAELVEAGAHKQSSGILRDLIVAARSLTLTAEDTKEAGWFDPIIVGGSQFTIGTKKSTRRKYWDLTGVSQRWLRDLLWEQLRYLALEPEGKLPSVTTVHTRIMSMRLLSKALRHLRDDDGNDPSRLTAVDAKAFKDLWELWYREQIPVVERVVSNPPIMAALSKGMRGRNVGYMRQVLIFGRDQEILGPWVIPFLKEFPQYDHVSKAPQPRPISHKDFQLMLCDESLDLLDSADLSDVGLVDMWFTHALQGGRIGETLELRLGCIGMIGNAQPYLWRDISKIRVVDYGMPCYLPVYERLQRRQAITRAKLRNRYAKELAALDAEGRASLEAEWDRTMPLFPGATTNPDLELTLSQSQFRSIFTAWIDKLGLTGITSHRTRATLATSLLNNGAPAALVRQVLGHISERAIAHYARYSDDNIARSLQQVWTAGPGMKDAGTVLMTPTTAAEYGSKSALADRIDLTVVPVEHGLCRYGPVVGGKSCPSKKNCSNGPSGPCPHFVLTGADLAYWERKRDAAYHFAEGAPSDEARDYILGEWKPWEKVLDGLRQTLDELGLLEAAQEMDLRSPVHDFFHPLFATGWTLTASQEDGDAVLTEEAS
ncbi:MAG: site-specific integrase [Fimbriimonadaceae bacterium]|nr:site-specific integrase [Fimbriimonadaceae bacterium]